MAANVPSVMVPPPPARNPVDQSLSFIRFGTEGNRKNIHNEDRLEAFGSFVSLTEKDILDMVSGFSKSNTAQVRINFGMGRMK